MAEHVVLCNSLNDQSRFGRVAELHLNAFRWVRQGYIPLGVIVQSPENMRGLEYSRWLDPRLFFEVQASILRDTLEVGSDYMPVLPMNHLGDVLIPTMFGAELHVPEGMGESLQDTGATPLPVLHDIREVDSLELPDMTSGLMPEVTAIAGQWRDLAPKWVDVVTPFPLGPFSMALQLRGSDLLTDLVDDPVRCHRLLDLCAQMQIRTEMHLRAALGDGVLPISNFGVYGDGRRIGDDSIIGLSPRMITEFAVPHLETISRGLGPSSVHFCTLPDRRADHVFEPLAASPRIRVASSQFAFEYYESHLEDLRGRLAIESLYGDAYGYICSKYGSFAHWARDFVPRFKDESGLVLYLWVSSVEEGRELWQIWQEAHRV